MNYSPTLKAAMEEIKAVLDKHDIAGAVVLHKPHYGKGVGEFLVKLDPSYSCVKVAGDGLYKIQARLQEDFKGNKKAFQEAKANTANMFNVMSELVGNVYVNLKEMSEAVDHATGAEHDTGNYTSHQSSQN